MPCRGGDERKIKEDNIMLDTTGILHALAVRMQ